MKMRFMLTILLAVLILMLAACGQNPVPEVPPPATSASRTYTEYEYNQIVKERDQLREELDVLKNSSNSSPPPAAPAPPPATSAPALPAQTAPANPGDVIFIEADATDFIYTVNSDRTASITGYKGQGGNVIIPATIQGFDVVSVIIGKNTSLVRVTIPDNVAEIGFWGCTSLVSVNIPDGVAKNNAIGYSTPLLKGTFMGCTSLESISIPEGVTAIEGRTFVSCTSLTSVTLPDSLTSIGGTGSGPIMPGAFEGCASLVSINIPDSVTSIAYNAFSGCTSLPRETMERIWQINPNASF